MNTTRAIAFLLAINGSAIVIAQQPPRPVPTTVWAEKPVKTPPYKTGLKARV